VAVMKVAARSVSRPAHGLSRLRDLAPYFAHVARSRVGRQPLIHRPIVPVA
jgi:hypothetical protein